MFLSPEDLTRIEQATAAAESTTRGEIVCVLAEEASPYMEVPFVWAAAGALVLPLFLLALGTATHLDDGLRGWSAAHIAATHSTVAIVLSAYALLQSILFIAITLVVSIPVVRRTLTPSSLKHGHVHQRALEQFFARDLHKTRERTGVLIYASLKDRCAEVIADAGINAKVDPRAWDEVIAALVARMRAGEPGEGFVAAIEKCRSLLATHFPAHGANANELPDVIVGTRSPLMRASEPR
jgi:putative membrane protein